MTHIETANMATDWPQLLDLVTTDRERVVIESGGVAKAALVTVEDLELLRRIEDYIDNQAADAAIAEGGDLIPWESVKKALDL
jgi:hypothetical protein